MAPLYDALHRIASGLFDLGLVAALIQFAGAIVITRAVVAAAVILVRSHDTVHARLVVTRGVLWTLNFTLAATLLNTLRLQSWIEIVTFAVVGAFRVGLERVFRWEQARLMAVPRLPAASGTESVDEDT